MKRKLFYCLSFLGLFIFFYSCLGNEDPGESDLYSNANFVSLKFLKNDSVPGIEDAVFTISDDSTTIQNVDSLPFQTRIDSICPQFTFKSTSMTQLIFSDTTITLNGGGLDTINFTLSENIQVKNVSYDGTVTKTYNLKVNVHQVEPELYIWKKLNDKILGNPGGKQKAVLFKNEFLFYSIGARTSLYTSGDATNWSEATVSNLPSTASLWYMTPHNDSLFVATEDDKLYASQDGRTWEEKDIAGLGTYTIENLLFSIKNRLCAIVISTSGTYHFAYRENGSAWAIQDEIPATFPVSGYTALVFNSFMSNPRGMITGGINKNGQLKQTNWTTENGTYWINVSNTNNTTLDAFSGGATIYYDGRLFLFGGMDNNNKTLAHNLKESKDQGLNWSIPDSTYNHMPEEYTPRSYVSAIVDENDKRIYLIGGIESSNYADVWTGKLNRLSFTE